MNDVLTQSIDALVAVLKREVETCSLGDELSGLLCHHFLGERAGQLGLTQLAEIDPAQWATKNESSLMEAPYVSVLGCLAYQHNQRGGSLGFQEKTAFGNGLAGLRARQKVFTTPNSWMLHPTNVLGVGLGASAIGDIAAEQRVWWKSTLRQGLEHHELPLFLKLVYFYALSMLSSSLENQSSPDLVFDNFGNYSLTELALSIWMVKRGLFQPAASNDNWLEESQAYWLSRCLLEGVGTLAGFKAAIALEVLTAYVFARTQYPRFELVIGLLSNFSAAMERWPNRWLIRDEYDVQALLWFILRSAFADARYEDNLPKLGRSGHRYDVGIPQLGLLVEAKYIRDPKKDFQRIADEIGKDSAQTTTQTTFKEILVFVYDASRAAEQHDWTKKTIAQIARVKGCIVHSAPSTMKARASSTKKTARTQS